MTPQALHRLATRLGTLSSIAVVLALLALTDIYHGEADVTLEWMVLRVAFVAIIAFHIAGFAALRRLRP